MNRPKGLIREAKAVRRLRKSASLPSIFMRRAMWAPYLSMTPELLRHASVRFERYAMGGDDHA